jgi:phosphate/sulfate permease
MESFYIIIVGILIVLAVIDLTVGVSNDATNFLSGAIGSRSAKFWVIMILASLGVIIGAIFSSGMMEIARNGIIKPEQFVFSEIILIFLAVMLTDILLLDFFNTFGFPTSTTVSLIFGLLGATVGISLIKMQSEGGILTEYINSDKALTIVFGILFSVVVAFIAGVVIQFFTRLVFSFNLTKTYKYFGAIWGGLSLAVITYFMFINGLKGSSLAEMDFVKYAITHKPLIFIVSFAGWSLLFQLLIWFTKINILKIVVLAGTFALAMAFAGNDLVNFIGVPLAGLVSYENYLSSGVSAGVFTMESLSEKIQTPTIFLLIAGLIMVLTLWLSKKAKSVTETSVNLSRQDSGYEQFGSSAISRSIVRFFVKSSNYILAVIPEKLRKKIEKRFEVVKVDSSDSNNIVAFDLIRASVNLVASSILIAIGTTNKLPLSTTYVTFIVAMGSSLADGAWGRESAVYRVTGVISVIGGWFITALAAFIISLIIAVVIYFGGAIAIGLLLLLTGYIFYRTKTIHKRREKDKETEQNKLNEDNTITEDNVFEKSTANILNIIENVPTIFSSTIEGLANEDLKLLKKMKKKVKKMSKDTREYKSSIHAIIQILKPSFLNSAHYYVQVIDYLRQISNATQFITIPSFDHIDNNHEVFINILRDDFEKLENITNSFVLKIKKRIKQNNFDDLEKIESKQQLLLHEIEELRTVQLLRIKNGEVDTRSSILYLNILTECKNIILYMSRLYKAQKAFMESKSAYIDYNN